MKNLTKILCAIFITITSLTVLAAPSTFAAPARETDGNSNSSANSNSKSNSNNSTENDNKTNNNSSTNPSAFNGRTGSACLGFLGLVSWDCDVNNIHDEDSLKAGIWQIVANIATDITIIAAYLVLGYVIYGGYLYIFSAGDPGKAAAGKKTLTHAFIGLAIVMAANLIMNTIRITLIGANNNLTNCAITACADAGSAVQNTIQWFIAMSGVVSAVFVLYGGISYITSAGDPSKLQKAKQAIIYALIGLAIVALAELITAFVSNLINNATSSQSTDTTYAQLTTKGDT